MVKTNPVIVLPLQTGQRPPQLTVNKTTFHPDPDHFSSLVTNLYSSQNHHQRTGLLHSFSKALKHSFI